MIDITSVNTDIQLYDTQVGKGANVLSVQLGALEYAPDFGVDINFFIDENFMFQNESFKSYLVQRLAEHNVNVFTVTELVEQFTLNYTFTVGEPEKATGGFIR